MNPTVSIEINDQVNDQLQESAVIDVHERADEGTSFTLTLAEDIVDGDLRYAGNEDLDPGGAVKISIGGGTREHCLVAGEITGQSIRLVHGGAGSSIEIKGQDWTAKMDRENKVHLWEEVTDADIVTAIASSYGLAPGDINVGPESPGTYTVVQRETDLQFIRRLARRNGTTFWVRMEDGTYEAHMTYEPGSPVTVLRINLPDPNVNTFDIDWDVERPTIGQAHQLNLADKSDIDGTAEGSASPFGGRTLDSFQNEEHSTHLAAPTSSVSQLAGRAHAMVADAGWFVEANCETTAQLLNDIIRVHDVVEVEGAGSRHSGMYYVAGVHHRITAGSYSMKIDLIRNAVEG